MYGKIINKSSDMKKKCIVVSGVNLIEGGTLTIFKQCLAYLDDFVANSDEYKVIALVHERSLFDYQHIEYKEVKWAKKNWLYRVYCEYIYFSIFSKRINPYLWFSLHDITPTVKAHIRVVYCHNSTPFYRIKLCDIRYSYKVFLFTLFYRFLYRINVHKNDYIVVQQNWLRDAFSKLLRFEKNKIIVAYPFTAVRCLDNKITSKRTNDLYTFFYPSLPRPFKNFEIICEAATRLEEKGITNFEVYLTLEGKENPYAHQVYKKYKKLKTIKFVGLLNKGEMSMYYEKVDCLIFPSCLETWGLPLSEFSIYNKPILAANLPYAKEAASNSKLTAFFNVNDSGDLMTKMRALINGETHILSECSIPKIAPPFTQSWRGVFDIILSKKG